MNVIELKNVSKDYKRKKTYINAVKECSFSIQKKDKVGFIGLNGAGKSTIIKLMVGIMMPTTGEISILGKDPFKNRLEITKKIGVLFGQRSNLIYDLPLKDSFNLLKVIYKINEKDFSSMLDLFNEYINLNELMDVPVREMSLGQRMRCEFASSLLHNPEILFLDEATLGIDFKTKAEIYKLLDFINKENDTTIFVTSHDINDIENICEDTIIIDNGDVIQHDNITNITENTDFIICELELETKPDFDKIMKSEYKILENMDDKFKVVIEFKRNNYKEDLNNINKIYSVMSVLVRKNDLETIVKKIHESRAKL